MSNALEGVYASTVPGVTLLGTGGGDLSGMGNPYAPSFQGRYTYALEDDDSTITAELRTAQVGKAVMGDTMYLNAVVENFEYEIGRIHDTLNAFKFDLDFLLGGTPTVILDGGVARGSTLVTGYLQEITDGDDRLYALEIDTQYSNTWAYGQLTGPYIASRKPDQQGRTQVAATYYSGASSNAYGGIYGQGDTALALSGIRGGPPNASSYLSLIQTVHAEWKWAVFKTITLAGNPVTVYPSGLIGSLSGQILQADSAQYSTTRATVLIDGVTHTGHIHCYFGTKYVTPARVYADAMAPGVASRYDSAKSPSNGYLTQVCVTWIPSSGIGLASSPWKDMLIDFEFYTISMAPAFHPALLGISPATYTVAPTSTIGFHIPKFKLDVPRIVKTVNRLSKQGIRVAELAKGGGKVLTTVGAIFACFPLTEEIAIPLIGVGELTIESGAAIGYVAQKADVASEQLIKSGIIHEPFEKLVQRIARVGVPLLGASALEIGKQIARESRNPKLSDVTNLISDVAMGLF
jgi:hypothetical protein